MTVAIGGAANTAPPSAMDRAAEMILQHQASDGAIVKGKLPAKQSRVVPYCGNFAARGLTAAYAATGKPHYLDGARRWVLWYETHMNPDGTIDDYTGAVDAWKPTGNCDSTDSYAGTYLEVIRAMYIAAPDLVWLRTRLPAVNKAMSAIRLTLQPNGLTYAKPKWPMMYLMDNTETLVGLHAAEEIGRVVNDVKLQHEAGQMAAKMEQAVTDGLWDRTRHVYAVALDATGAQVRASEKWYPDLMGNLMAIGWLPQSQRHVALLQRLKEEYRDEIPNAIHVEDDLNHLVWWGIAARGAGDEELFDEVLQELKNFDGRMKSLPQPDVLGNICLIIAAGRP